MNNSTLDSYSRKKQEDRRELIEQSGKSKRIVKLCTLHGCNKTYGTVSHSIPRRAELAREVFSLSKSPGQPGAF